jgi:hypothetical protein
MSSIKALGIVAIATSVVLLTSGTGGFTAMNADRPTALSVTDDESALVDYDVTCKEKTVRNGPSHRGPNDNLVDADLGGNESAGSDDDGVDADILSNASADSDDDIADANVFSNESARSNDDIIGVNVFSNDDIVGVDIGSSPRVTTKAELTVTVINRFSQPLEGSVTVDGTTKAVGPISPGGTENVTFDGEFDAGEPIIINVAQPVSATLNRSVPEDCKHFTDEDGKGISFVTLCGVSLDADIDVSATGSKDPTSVHWNSNQSVELIVTKAGSNNGAAAAEPGIQNHQIGDILSGIVDAFGEDPSVEQTPSSPCPDGKIGVKFDWEGSSFGDGETVGTTTDEDEGESSTGDATDEDNAGLGILGLG